MRLALSRVDELLARRQDLVDLHLEWGESGLLRRLAESFAERSEHGVAFLTADLDAGGMFALVAGSGVPIDMQAIGGAVAAALGGRGGGRDRIFQGRCDSMDARDEALEVLRRSLG